MLSMLTAEIHTQDGAPMWTCRRGTTLPGGFVAWKRLAVGLRCETWLVWSVPLWCPAVLRMPRPHQLTQPGAAQSLEREVAALQGNLHPALPRLYVDGTGEDVPHVVLEHVDGPTLDEEISAGAPLSEPEVALIGATLLTGLRALHHRGVAHVDVKPAHIVLRDMRPVLVDFGSARRIGSRQRASLPLGTAAYAAPELEAYEPISAGMDLYALGVTLNEALTGSPTIGPLGGTPLTDLVRSLLEPDPARRPTTAEALTALAAALPDDLRPWPAWADALAPFAGIA
jgi:serine/threonine protein kinase